MNIEIDALDGASLLMAITSLQPGVVHATAHTSLIEIARVVLHEYSDAELARAYHGEAGAFRSIRAYIDPVSVWREEGAL